MDDDDDDDEPDEREPDERPVEGVWVIEGSKPGGKTAVWLKGSDRPDRAGNVKGTRARDDGGIEGEGVGVGESVCAESSVLCFSVSFRG